MKRDRLFGWLAAVGSLLLIAVGLELYVRIFVDDGMRYDLEMWKYAREMKEIVDNPRLGHEHKPGVSVHLMGVDIEINSKKLRGNNRSYDRAPGTTRILMLGDSVTLGWGVAADETTSKRMEKRLNESGVKAEVINAGVGNYNTIMEVEYFLTEGYRYQPDIVILNYFINDAEPVPSYDHVGWFARTSYAYAYFAGRLDVLFRQLATRDDWASYYLKLYEEGAPGWAAASERIDALAEYCRREGITLLIANYPELRNLKDYRFGRVQDLVHAAAEGNGASYLDLLDSVRDVEESRLWVTRPDPHPNSYAHELFADALFEKVKELL